MASSVLVDEALCLVIAAIFELVEVDFHFSALFAEVRSRRVPMNAQYEIFRVCQD